MFEKIILPILMIIGGILGLLFLYKSTRGFLKEDSYSNSQSFGVWGAGVIIIVAGIIFLIKGIIYYINL